MAGNFALIEASRLTRPSTNDPTVGRRPDGLL